MKTKSNPVEAACSAELSSPPKGRFTIFHLWWVIAVFNGLSIGIAYGAIHFGWGGAIIGALVGLVLGVIAGWLPRFLFFMFFSHRSRDGQAGNNLKVKS